MYDKIKEKLDVWSSKRESRDKDLWEVGDPIFV
jgi:hypothetical protein